MFNVESVPLISRGQQLDCKVEYDLPGHLFKIILPDGAGEIILTEEALFDWNYSSCHNSVGGQIA